jgi:hypothetical protein
MGKFQAYDLKDFFSGKDPKARNVGSIDTLEIPADPLLQDPKFKNFLTFREMKQRVQDGGKVSGDSLVASNPFLYQTYAMAAGQAMQDAQWEKAVGWYQRGLQLEVATKPERIAMEKGLKQAMEALKKSR